MCPLQTSPSLCRRANPIVDCNKLAMIKFNYLKYTLRNKLSKITRVEIKIDKALHKLLQMTFALNVYFALNYFARVDNFVLFAKYFK